MKLERFGGAAKDVALAAFFALTALLAHAGPPFRTDDPEAVEYKHAEVYVFGQETLTADGRSGMLPRSNSTTASTRKSSCISSRHGPSTIRRKEARRVDTAIRSWASNGSSTRKPKARR